MFFHPIKKLLGLIILYSTIIVGIFVLQFRNESVISRNFGSLRFSLAQTQEQNGQTALKNSLQVSFKGIAFAADEVRPAILTKKDESNNIITENLTLSSYEQLTPLSVVFRFKDKSNEDVAITFTASDTNSDATLSIMTNLPKDAESVSLNFKPTSGYSVTDKTNARQIFSSKNGMFAFLASKITDNEFVLSSKNPFATFAVYDPSTIFSFASVDPDMAIATTTTYEHCINNMKNKLVSEVTESIKTSQFNEISIVAYVAEMAAQGKYSEAIASVPNSFKKDNKRTYLSAPYFGSLEAMYSSLVMRSNNVIEMINNAAASPSYSQSSLNIFTVKDFADFINIIGSTENVKKVLSIPKTVLEDASLQLSDEKGSQMTIAQATGILRTYTKLSEYRFPLAESLLPAVESCLATIEANCSLTDSSLTVMENDVPISTIESLETGSALIEYGKQTSNQELITAGMAIISSVLLNNSLDLTTISEVYPIIVNNKNYPHYTMLYRDKNLWAFTMLDNINYTVRNNVASINMKSNIGDVHYLIVSNMNEFKDINIYGLSYHADARFENYNSSGYIYKSATNSLFLKTRHKSETEVVKLTF